jgi:sulfatase maturation enzyme AslB (radical SAM superfamily)
VRAPSIEKMELESFGLILTDRCNFKCSYCYQGKGNDSLDFPTLARTIDFFSPFFSRECVLSFYGGEPLLAFDLIRQAVRHVQGWPAGDRRKVRFSLTTNGSLLDKKILEFLAEHHFSLVLSFDGLAQDLTRKRGSSNALLPLIAQILNTPRISLETNSVFTSETIGYLSKSVEFLVRLGVPRLDVNFAHVPPWTEDALFRLEDEILRVGEFFLSRYKELEDIPWFDFCQELDEAVHYCPAGEDRMALSAQGTLWGCVVFPHYREGKHRKARSREYCFGDLDSFIKNSRRIYAQKMALYSELRMDRFSTPDLACLTCDDLEHCWICPLSAGLTSGEIGKIAAASCKRARILRRVKHRFLDEFKQRGRRSL